jgi:tetratricopeptide (TPR) repeat protein
VDPHNPEVYDALGQVYLDQGEFERAADRFRKALEEDDQYAMAYGHLGIAYFRLMRWEDAIPSFRKAIEYGSAAPEYYYALGWSYINLSEDCERAVPYFEMALELDIWAQPAWDGLDYCEE